MLTPRDVHRLAVDLAGCPERTIAAALQARSLDATERAAVRIEIDACRAEKRISAAGLATDQVLTLGHMATDAAVPSQPPVAPEMARWLRRAGLDPARHYTDDEITQAFRASDLGIEERIAVRHHLSSLGRLRAAGARPSVQAGRDMSAKAAPAGHVLTDRQGRPLVLRSRPA